MFVLFATLNMVPQKVVDFVETFP